MKLRYFILGGFLLGVAWNVFLIHRDQNLFEKHLNTTQKELHCASFSSEKLPPDCNVE
jgi:hypothetical protein